MPLLLRAIDATMVGDGTGAKVAWCCALNDEARRSAGDAPPVANKQAATARPNPHGCAVATVIHTERADLL